MAVRFCITGRAMCHFIGTDVATEALNSSAGALVRGKSEHETRAVQRQAAGCRRTPARVVRERRQRCSGGCQSRIQALKNGYRRTTVSEGQLDAPTAVDQPRGHVHQLLHHGADASAFGPVARRGVRTKQSVLPDPTQDVVGERGAGEDQGVGGELARG